MLQYKHFLQPNVESNTFQQLHITVIIIIKIALTRWSVIIIKYYTTHTCGWMRALSTLQVERVNEKSSLNIRSTFFKKMISSAVFQVSGYHLIASTLFITNSNLKFDISHSATFAYS